MPKRSNIPPWAEHVRELHEQFGFTKYPKCGVQHTALTVTCRECGYCSIVKEKEETP